MTVPWFISKGEFWERAREYGSLPRVPDLLPILCLVFLILWGSARVLAAAEAAQAPATLTLRSLKIVGNKTIPTKKLMEELVTVLPSRWPWKELPAFKPSDLEADVERLTAIYRVNGFYHGKITPRVKTANGQVEVTLTVKEGPWVKVTEEEVNIAPTTPPVDLSALQGKWPLKPGDRFVEKTYDAFKRLYLDYLLDHGYPRARVEGRVLLDEEKNTAEINITVKPGPLCYFGEVRIQGGPETPKRVILRKLTFKQGDLFSFKELYDSQRAIYGLDLFGSVTLTAAEVPEPERRIPVIVEVQGKKQRSLKVGLGYGDEDQFRTKLALRFRNVGGGGRMLDLDAKYSNLEYRVEGTFFNPLIFSSKNDLVFQSGVIRRYLPGFTDKAYFTNLRLERDLPWHFRGYLGHAFEFARPFNIPIETLLILAEATQPGKLYRSSMMVYGLRQETVDSVTDPHRGGILALGGEVAPDFLGSNLEYVRTVVEARRYHGLGLLDITLAGRLKFGAIAPMQSTFDIPAFRRFFAGGLNSVRGYRLDYLGPRDSAGNPLGGQALVEGSFETRIPLYKEFGAVAFLDFGNVYLKIRDIDLGQLKYASGVGLRYYTLIGPIGVDIGFPLNPIDRNKDRYHVNFTVGQVF
jgi:outer membrane protein insertion porin family